MPAKAGRYELRIGVRDTARGQSGTVYAFVDIPAFSKTPFIWSEIGLSVPESKPAVAGGIADVMPMAPSARRDFDRREHVTAFLSAYHLTGPLPAPIGIVTRVVDAENRQKFEQHASFTPADFGAVQTAAYKIDIPLATLDPGPYVLMMEATAGKVRTTRSVRFALR
jgi:hypothetical protein